MTFRNRLQYLLVKKLNISNKEALSLILNGEININGSSVLQNVIIEPEFTVVYNNQVLQTGKVFKYIAYYKPVGIETTLNESINNNLKQELSFEYDVYPIGRLDKASEGLLILTNDGRLYDKVLRKENNIEKHYEVRLDKPLTSDFLYQMSSGIKIMGKLTLPCTINKLSETSFQIILIQGLNRQIRRMCYKLGFEVTFLKRTKIGNLDLDKLQPNEWRDFNPSELLPTKST